MKRQFEEKLLIMISRDIRELFKDEKSITENYFDAWCYVNQIIDTDKDNASQYLLSELYCLRAEYQYKYLVNKGLI